MQHTEAAPRRTDIHTDPDAVGVQISNSTKLNRYPAVFSAAAQLCKAAGIEAPHILSFGSSTGEEAHTLTTRYFPGSQILGIDVSDEALEKARETYGDNPAITFEKSGTFEPAKESFDVIFAMSVLCRWPETRKMDDIAKFFPFANFEKQTDYLDSLLKPGGILVIYNASYSFLHSRTSEHYDLVLHPRISTAGFVKRFAKDGKHDERAIGIDCLYRKQPAADYRGKRALVIRDHNLREAGMIERDIAL